MREYLKKIRAETMLPQKVVAENLHMSRANYTKIENGERQKNMTLKTIQDLAQIFNTSVDEIVRLETAYKQSKGCSGFLFPKLSCKSRSK